MRTEYAVPAAPGVRARVLDLGTACCAVEFGAAVLGGLLAPVRDDDPDPGLHVLVVSGTVTDLLAPAVVREWGALAEPRGVLSFGACSNTGGPYWDSYSVTKGIDQLVPVDVYVPGCPPRPEALVAGLERLRSRVAAGRAPGAPS